MQSLPAALAPMGQFAQWVLWIGVPDPKRPGKTNKFVIDPHSRKVVDAHTPGIWMTFEQAASLKGDATGVGFVFTERDPFFFIDIDDALDTNGNWNDISKELGTTFAGAAVEISQSGRGAHIFGCGIPAIPSNMRRKKGPGFDIYTEKRFVAMTGTGTYGNAFHDCQNALDGCIDKYLLKTGGADFDGWTESPCDGWKGVSDDNEMIIKALASGSAGSVFGTKASFRDLWECNIDKLAVAFPPDGNGAEPWDRSSADAALCSHLAFWTGRDCARIDRVFRLSALMRDKWDREDYCYSTIILSCSGDGDVYDKGGEEPDNMFPSMSPTLLNNAPAQPVTQPAQPIAANVVDVNGIAAAPTSKSGSVSVGVVSYSNYDKHVNSIDLPEYFSGCTYVVEDHAILVPGGLLLDQGRFKSSYGGAVFALDIGGDKTTRNAWEALTENIALRFPKVDKTTFSPELAPGTIVKLQGTSAVNTYWPVVVDRKQGDATLFINHINKLLPMGDDAAILLTYMAALVQNPGHKFQWCPIIQGPEGNGKTAIMECMTNAVGEKYCHLPNAQDLGGNGSKFTGWLQRKLFIGVEEIYCADRREVTEMLKPLITNRRVEIQGKGADQITGDNRANWLMMTNHKDAVPVGIDSRRYCTLFCYQQTAEELITAGMDREYYNTLYNWLRFNDGFAIVTDFLMTYQCDPRFDPSEQGGVMRAPKTTSTQEAVTLSVGVIEQEILESVEQGRPGFCAPWLSSMALDTLLKEIRRNLPNVKRPEMLKTIGYVPHPGLLGGRVNRATVTDAGKTRLYVKSGHQLELMTGAVEIAKRYDADQCVLPSAAEKVFN